MTLQSNCPILTLVLFYQTPKVVRKVQPFIYLSVIKAILAAETDKKIALNLSIYL